MFYHSDLLLHVIGFG
ncbi:hypothetical protein [Serratia fonticola]